jgi:hypothetical protein
VLPVTSAFEAEGLKIGFEVSQEAQSLVQLRTPVAPPAASRARTWQIIFALATRLGLGEHFWDGDLDAAWRHQLAPSGVTLEQLRAEPAGVRVPLTTPPSSTPSPATTACRAGSAPHAQGRALLGGAADHGYPPLPEFSEPGTSPRSRPDLAERFPLSSPARSRCTSARPSTATWRACDAGRPTRRSSCTPTPRGSAASPVATGSASPPRTAASAHAPASTRASTRRSCAASTAGGRAARSSTCPATRRRPRQRQPEPRAAPAAERSGQRQLTAARVALRCLAAGCRGGCGAYPSIARRQLSCSIRVISSCSRWAPAAQLCATASSSGRSPSWSKRRMSMPRT